MEDLPFRAEYAKSNRSSCKSCKGNIPMNDLRMAIMVQSSKFDGRMPNWFHYTCFFRGSSRVSTVADIGHFNQLRWDDQQKIKEKIGMVTGMPMDSPDGGKGKKGKSKGKSKAGGGDSKANPMNEFYVEYAKSNRSSCRGCGIQIDKGTVRLSIKEYESESAIMYGPQHLWHHVDCFVERREEFNLFESADKIPGFPLLNDEDKKIVKSKLPAIKGEKRAADGGKGDVPSKKQKSENNKHEKELREQNDAMFKKRDQLTLHLTKAELQDLLTHNKQDVPSGESRIMDRLSDVLTFGALEPCPECKGQLVYASDSEGYLCHGDLTEWTKCSYQVMKPLRRPFKIPKELKETYSFLKSYKYSPRDRVYEEVVARAVRPSAAVSKPSTSNGTSKPGPPLANMKFAFAGHLSKSAAEIKTLLKNLGGRVVDKVDTSVAAVISTAGEVEKKSRKIQEAENNDVHVVSEDFVDAASEGDIPALIKDKSIASWGGAPEERIARCGSKSASNGRPGSMSSNKVFKRSGKVKMTIKGGAAVEPDSGLENVAHVLKDQGDLFTIVMSKVDVKLGTNSYYKIQVLEADNGGRYWLYRAWGRVGTTIGGSKVESKDDKDEAINAFCDIFEERTGNNWYEREKFVKRAGAYQILDVDYGQDESDGRSIQLVKAASKSKLHKAIQDLVCLLFDVDAMKKTLLEFEIDLEKMPLGKLSKRQIQSAYSVLTEIQGLLSSQGSESRFVDASNRFYTLLPHNFGMKKPTILNTNELLKSKIEMLDSLLEIEVAYSMLQVVDGDKDKDPIDAHYDKLATDIEVLEEESDEFKMLKKYVKNTHASTHDNYSLHIQHVYKIARHKEAARYKPFKKLPNRQLLWHGSRTSNFAGILSQGLRIAPPEAPTTGYMFGKGIYFADMVSKSANYCFTSKSNSTGLLMLCEVALGNMHELTQADYITKPPGGKHSTKGLGITVPDPSQKVLTPDGVEVPLGKGIKTDVTGTSLLYNEYIVYDVAQVNAKYLIKMNFKFK